MTRRILTDGVDRLLGSDPGLTRLLGALQAVVAIAAAMLAESLFVRATHALQIDAHGAVVPLGQEADIAAQHHGVFVVAIMLGALVALLASFTAAMFATPLARLMNFAVLPVPMVAGLALGLALSPFRVLILASLVVVLTVGAYWRRFGPRGFVCGLAVFIGDLFGLLTGRVLHPDDLGWLFAEVVIGAAVAGIVQFTLFYPSRRAALRRVCRSHGARARELARAAVDVLNGTDHPSRASRRLHRRLIRLNETALMVDAHLAHPSALPAGWSASRVHERLFDSELALTSVVRGAERIADLPVPAGTRERAGQALAAIATGDARQAEQVGRDLLSRRPSEQAGGDEDRDIALHRFAVSVLVFTEAADASPVEIRSHTPANSPRLPGTFEPAVGLVGGWLPGSAIVSAVASAERVPRSPIAASLRDRLRRWDRVALDPSARVAIQMAVAITAAVVLGDLVSGRRAYWAVITAFITFMATNNAGEQLRKAAQRVAGTAVGVVLGALVPHLFGHRTDVSIAVVLGSVFFGLYLIRINHVFMAIGITVMLSEITVELDQFTDSLLIVRLEETLVGAAVAALTVLFVVPLRTGRVAGVAARHYLHALADVSEQATLRLAEPANTVDLRSAIRRLDAAYHTLVTTIQPLGLPFLRIADGPREVMLRSAAASRHYARDLLAPTAAEDDLTPVSGDRVDIAANLQLIDREMATLAQSLPGDVTSRVPGT